ncbi:MAG TPA: phospholipase D-like domain-containing protein [Ktedonobacterales bacterium]|jgi:phosphatidylserine/phosphatidylglycerophosphate/cardiolipin synthase-like enzyme
MRSVESRAQRRWLGKVIAPLAVIMAILPWLVSCTPGSTELPAGMPSWLSVYFSDPNPPDQVNNGIDRFVTPVLKDAKKTIDVTSFDLNLPSVVNALVDAKKRGVAVRVVTDETNGTQTLKASDSPSGEQEDTLKTFSNAGIPVVDGGRSNGLMHNKIIIVDGATLFMGSWNMSYNDTFRNDNNLLKITDKTLIANYQAKFNELFVDKRFGTKAKVGAQTQQLTIDGTPVANYFSPVDEVVDKLVAQMNGAQHSIKFMMFTFTQKDITNAMIARSKAGVQVEGVIENRGASQGSAPVFYCAHVPAKLDGNKYTMHHKVVIIDDKTVITGSFNFTQTADDANDDNVLIINSPAVATLYNQEFDKVYGQAKDQSSVDCKAA